MSIILGELQKYSSAERKKANEWFFKTGKRQYGESDRFIGVSNPDVRKVVKQFTHLSFREITEVLHSEIHEERLAGVLILVEQYQKAVTNGERLNIAQYYLKNLRSVNNWDLVDLSSYKVLGRAILENIVEENILDKLAMSKNMWDRRVAIISTMVFIREGNYDTSLRIAEKILDDTEDLTHKAVGWTLREVWKRNPDLCEQFLLTHYSRLPRTTLRYAIERMEERKRKKFLMRDKK